MERSTKEKIILLLSAGVALGFVRTPRNYFKILDGVAQDWKEIDRRKLVRIIHEFRNDRIVKYEENDDTVKIILTKEGKRKSLEYQLDEIKIRKLDKWDKKWRIVIFDIPEKKKKAREALRKKLKELGFKELQKSVFVIPYECEDEIDFIVEVFGIRPYVRVLKVDSFTDEEQFRLKFKLF